MLDSIRLNVAVDRADKIWNRGKGEDPYLAARHAAKECLRPRELKPAERSRALYWAGYFYMAGATLCASQPADSSCVVELATAAIRVLSESESLAPDSETRAYTRMYLASAYRWSSDPEAGLEVLQRVFDEDADALAANSMLDFALRNNRGIMEDEVRPTQEDREVS